MSEPRRPEEVGAGPPFDHEIRFKTLVILGLVLLALVLLAALVSKPLYDLFVAQEKLGDAPPPVLLEATLPVQVPGPRLLATPERELDRVRAAEEEVLTSYAWVDESAAVVRIPVERAIELLAERGSAAPGPEGGDGLPPGRTPAEGANP